MFKKMISLFLALFFGVMWNVQVLANGDKNANASVPLLPPTQMQMRDDAQPQSRLVRFICCGRGSSAAAREEKCCIICPRCHQGSCYRCSGLRDCIEAREGKLCDFKCRCCGEVVACLTCYFCCQDESCQRCRVCCQDCCQDCCQCCCKDCCQNKCCCITIGSIITIGSTFAIVGGLPLATVLEAFGTISFDCCTALSITLPTIGICIGLPCGTACIVHGVENT